MVETQVSSILNVIASTCCRARGADLADMDVSEYISVCLHIGKGSGSGDRERICCLGVQPKLRCLMIWRFIYFQISLFEIQKVF